MSVPVTESLITIGVVLKSKLRRVAIPENLNTRGVLIFLQQNVASQRDHQT
jgi:hypothetical protein